jgi:hypothetical protein
MTLPLCAALGPAAAAYAAGINNQNFDQVGRNRDRWSTICQQRASYLTAEDFTKNTLSLVRGVQDAAEDQDQRRLFRASRRLATDPIRPNIENCSNPHDSGSEPQ